MDILEYCKPEDVLSREQYYMDLIKPTYNLLKFAGSRTGFKHSDLTLSKMSQSQKGRPGKNTQRLLKNLLETLDWDLSCLKKQKLKSVQL